MCVISLYINIKNKTNASLRDRIHASSFSIRKENAENITANCVSSALFKTQLNKNNKDITDN